MLPFEHMKVVEWGHYLSAPMTATMLGVCGADVVKIEEPSHGDTLRSVYLPVFKATEKKGLYFELKNQGKRSIAMNLHENEGKEIAHDLISKSDIFLTNMRPKVLEVATLDPDTLLKKNHRLIYGWNTAYGRHGPERNRPGFQETVFWAESGFWASLGFLGEPPPHIPAEFNEIGDQLAALSLFAGISAALLTREKTGKGQLVHTSLLGNSLWVQQLALQASVFLNNAPLKKNNRYEIANPLANIYRTEDGVWLYLMNFRSDPIWPGFCKAIGREELIDDDRFNSTGKRSDNCNALISIIEDTIGEIEAADLERQFVEHDIVYARVKDISNATSNPQVLSNNLLFDYEHPRWGLTKYVKTLPWDLDNSSRRIKRAPELGEHSEEVLLQLGYSWERIQDLRTKGIIGPRFPE